MDLTEFRRLAGLRLTEAVNPKLQAIKSALSGKVTKTGGRLKATNDTSGDYPGVEFEPSIFAKAAHWRGNVEDWYSDYANPLIAEIETLLKKAGVSSKDAVVDVSEQGYVFVQVPKHKESLGEQTSGTKMVFGKLRKLKKSVRKAGDQSDRTMDRIDKATDKAADLAAKRGGKLGKVGASLYHQTQAAKHFGQGLRNKALGQHGKAKKRFGQAGSDLKTGIKTGFKAAASFK
jgi:hypothetical protein